MALNSNPAPNVSIFVSSFRLLRSRTSGRQAALTGLIVISAFLCAAFNFGPLPRSNVAASVSSVVPETGSRFKILGSPSACGTPGALDTSFDTDGKVFTRFGSFPDVAYAIALQADGKTVVAGMTQPGEFAGYDFALLRYNVDGSLDSTFGTGGKVTTNIGGFDEAYALVIQPDGKIVAGGYTHSGSPANINFALVRYHSNGSPDTSFGNGGIVNSDLDNDVNRIAALALQPDGKIVAAGSSQSSNTAFAIARYNSDGSLDLTFSDNGYYEDGGSGQWSARSVVIQNDGKIVVAGMGSAALIIRLNPDGTPDQSFSGDGEVIMQNTAIASAALQADGRIILAGSRPPEFMVARLNTNGSFDTSFGTNGIAATAVGTGGSGANAVMIEPDGMIMTVGSAQGTGGEDFALVRFYPNGTLDPSFGTGGKAITPVSVNRDRADAAALLPDGRIVAAGQFAVGPKGDNDIAIARFVGRACASEITVADATTFLADGGSIGFGIGNVGNPGAPRTITLRNDGTQTLSIGTFTVAGTNAGDFTPNTTGTAASLSPGATTTFTLTFTPSGPGVRSASLQIANSDPEENPFDLNLTGTGYSGVLYTVNVTSAHGTVTSSPSGINCPGDCSENYDEGAGAVLSLTPRARVGYRFAGWSGDATGNAVPLSVPVNGNKNITANFLSITAFDYDGDSLADLSVWRPSNNTWYFQTVTNFTFREFGAAGDIVTPADFDGDYKTDIIIFRPSEGRWYYVLSSTQTFTAFNWGQPGDIPIPLKTTQSFARSSPVVYRPSTGGFFVSTGQGSGNVFGPGQVPVRGDFDADGIDDFATYSPTNHRWDIRKSGGGTVLIEWGEDGDKAVPADYDGDGATDIAVWRPSTGKWWIIGSTAGWITHWTWGEPDDKPVPADYDGDGRADVAVWRPSNGTWYIANSSDFSVRIRQFGETGDIPTPGAFIY